MALRVPAAADTWFWRPRDAGSRGAEHQGARAEGVFGELAITKAVPTESQAHRWHPGGECLHPAPHHPLVKCRLPPET